MLNTKRASHATQTEAHNTLFNNVLNTRPALNCFQPDFCLFHKALIGGLGRARATRPLPILVYALALFYPRRLVAVPPSSSRLGHTVRAGVRKALGLPTVRPVDALTAVCAGAMADLF